MTDDELEQLRKRAAKLRLYGLLAAWDALGREPWVAKLLDLEERERAQRSREYRIKSAKIGAFKPIVDFDWKHPSKIDRALVEELFDFDFLTEPANVVLLGPNGVGKTMIAQNLAYEAALRGHSVRFCVAADLLNDLSGLDGATLRTRVKRYVAPKLLVLDEVGYLRYDDRHADLLYEVVRRRYERGVPIVVTTNKAFSEWNQVFESAACLVTLIDRLCHRAEIIEIRGASYRVKESKARSTRKRKARRKR
ncbi:ATP-binding protein [Pseudenhygromyxa sp. WMMC2535]|uniref:ATP-binding protein n=1 Tax=Pseudenhygromyxa sp. WMMC2535 TaxID=2712867 RepID=UPI0015554A74|nr:ATP-binding protein [Pseudenhygromyxa sp. WMMC2535]NVB39959.1 ATP-binding protein [Pseudenhygromyxa sp. WMMC2535]